MDNNEGGRSRSAEEQAAQARNMSQLAERLRRQDAAAQARRRGGNTEAPRHVGPRWPRKVGRIASKALLNVPGEMVGLGIAAAESKYVRGSARFARSSVENWVHNFDPRGRDKLWWSLGLAAGGVETVAALQLGPAGGWVKAGLNFAVVQGISIGAVKYFERNQNRALSEAESRGLVGTDLSNQLEEVAQKNAASAKRMKDFFAGVSAGNSLGSIGVLGFDQLIGTNNLEQLFAKALETRSVTPEVATSAATTTTTAAAKSSGEASAAVAPTATINLTGETSVIPTVKVPEVEIKAPPTPKPVLTEFPIPNNNPTAGLSASELEKFELFKNENVIAGAARDAMNGYGDYLSIGVNETQMGGVGQKLVEQIMQTNQLDEISRIQVEAMVKKVIEDQANQAFTKTISGLAESNSNDAIIGSSVDLLNRQLEDSSFQQSLADHAKERFVQTIQQISVNPDAFQPADVTHLAGVSDAQVVMIENRFINLDPDLKVFHALNNSNVTEAHVADLKQAVFEAISQDIKPKLIEQAGHIAPEATLNETLKQYAQIGKDLPAESIADKLAQEFKDITGVLVNLTDEQIEKLNQLIDRVNTEKSSLGLPTDPKQDLENFLKVIGLSAAGLTLLVISSIVARGIRRRRGRSPQVTP